MVGICRNARRKSGRIPWGDIVATVGKISKISKIVYMMVDNQTEYDETLIKK
ncbi:MAG: hypothetical protein LBH80_06305 [Prevotellaceae bacterium]|nr:hypothetical protein [Prevotellaceae bacterium]